MRDAREMLKQDLNLSLQQRLQILARETYDSDRSQMAVSVLLLTNFALSITQVCRKRPFSPRDSELASLSRSLIKLSPPPPPHHHHHHERAL
jgi:hypothetical protein